MVLFVETLSAPQRGQRFGLATVLGSLGSWLGVRGFRGTVGWSVTWHSITEPQCEKAKAFFEVASSQFASNSPPIQPVAMRFAGEHRRIRPPWAILGLSVLSRLCKREWVELIQNDIGVTHEQKGKRLCYPESLRGRIPPGNKQVARASDEGNVSPSVPDGKVCVRESDSTGLSAFCPATNDVETPPSLSERML
ncbi:hypothetical protein Q8A67_015386 [Cirrhinus molitorella]|uniref:Uncharacterized protein n=1 Tax=Cirrhinus molitorella TaxID=172907 RepID=A0AA88PLN7_9TELE|nr:hypothetical protein Q8A67_015386 [Cirrhinus molitorella]